MPFKQLFQILFPKKYVYCDNIQFIIKEYVELL